MCSNEKGLASMTIYTPTYLYIKQHSITGKLYFGKTITDPEKYLGSGKHWKRHIKKHGKEHVVTLWYCLFYDQEECTKFALMFSEQQNIAQSDIWLNLKPENGRDGTIPGTIWTDEQRLKFKIATTGKPKPGNVGKIPHNKGKGKYKPEKLSPEQRRIKNINNLAGATEKSIIANTGKLWWTNGIVEQKSIDQPSLYFKRGRMKRLKKSHQCLNGFLTFS